MSTATIRYPWLSISWIHFAHQPSHHTNVPGLVCLLEQEAPVFNNYDTST